MNHRRPVCLLVLFLLTGCAPASVYGLRPEYPQPVVEGNPPRAAFVKVDSLQPTLQWESFPDADDRKADWGGQLARIRNVTYDLKIFRAERGYPAEVIYVRSGLPRPWHGLQIRLEPSANYFWTVRARFQLDGATRVTPWGRIRAGASSNHVVPSPYYYGLRTPAK